MKLQPHQQRVVDEKAELDGRLDRLLSFIAGTVFRTLPDDERGRLRQQAGLMSQLSTVLRERIEAFGSTAA